MGAPLLLIAVVLLLHGRSMGYGWSYWDDHDIVAQNPLLQEASLPAAVEILRPAPRPGEAMYIPVSYLAWSAERGLFGHAPQALHRVNVALHALNGILAFVLLLALIGRPALALLGAVLFVAHPVQVEVVAWIIGGRDLLAGTFVLLCLLAYLRYLTARRRRWLLVALACYALSILSKPVAAPLPAVLLLLDYRQMGSWRRCLWWSKVPFLAITLLAYGLNVVAGDPTVQETVALSQRLLAVPWLAWHWTRAFLVLAGPVPFHPWSAAGSGATGALPGLASCGVAIVLGVLAWRRGWAVLWQALLASVVLFAPAVLVVLEGKRSFVTADRFGYLPLLALCALVPCTLLPLRGGPRSFVGVVLGLWLLACALTTHGAVATWRDGAALWSRVLAVYPDEHEALVNRGSAFARDGRFDEAWQDYRRALGQRPTSRMLLANVARLCLDRKRPADAIVFLERYLAVGPEDVETYVGLGYAAGEAGRTADALRWYAEAARLAPGDPQVAIGRRRVLVADARRRLATDADDVAAILQLARAADEEGRRPEAERLLRRAIALPSPQRATALFHLGRMLLDRGAVEEGRGFLRAALDEDPAYEPARKLLER